VPPVGVPAIDPVLSLRTPSPNALPVRPCHTTSSFLSSYTGTSLYIASSCPAIVPPRPAKARVFSTRMRGSACGGTGTLPSRHARAVTRRLYIFSFASRRSIRTEPSSDTPANSPFVFEYANMPETLFSDAAPAASAFLPTGPAAMDTFPPSVRLPTCANVFTALASLRIKTKSVSSNPICPPKPPPTVPIALGADQDPSPNRATTTPLPKRPDPRKPALKTVRIARPLAFARTEGGMTLSGPNDCLGSTKEARIRPHFLHSPVEVVS
jgi:hypothetical protein